MSEKDTWVNQLPQIRSWEEAGDACEGWLVGKDMGPGPNDQLRGEYTVDTKDGLRMIFGTTKIDQGLARVDTGAYVRITYLGEEKTAKGFTLKQFSVEVKAGARLFPTTGELISEGS